MRLLKIILIAVASLLLTVGIFMLCNGSLEMKSDRGADGEGSDRRRSLLCGRLSYRRIRDCNKVEMMKDYIFYSAGKE